MDKQKKVCVTGSAGYIGSSIVKQLLERGYSVHATLRNLGDASKVALLKGLPYADEKLVLFQANIYNPDDFESAIQGCEAVIQLATPLQHNADNSRSLMLYKNTSEAAVAGVKSIAESCIRSGTVKRLIYTASVVAASALKEDGTGYKDSMDETCWTPLNLSLAYSNDFLIDYVHSKTLAEEEVLRYNGEELEVVSVACGLVGGEAVHSTVSQSNTVLLAQFLKDEDLYQSMRFLEELIGKVPVVHVQDATAAHIFLLENSALTGGRFLCAAAFLRSSEIANFIQKCYPEIKIDDEFIEDSMRDISLGTSKLEKFGFQYKYDVEQIIRDSVRCAR